MKANNKILLNEYKSKIRKIISNSTSQTINFSQFMQLLSLNCIRTYSKAQISKIKKFFDNPTKTCRIQIPFSYLQLDCVQECQRFRYYVVKVSQEKVYNNLVQIQQKKHNVMKCLQTFINIMRRLYGSSKNWFKVLGGLTVSITIESPVFTRSLARILCNTSHTTCAESLTNLFLKQSNGDKIQWKGFMKVINIYDNIVTQPIMQAKFDWKTATSHSIDITKVIFSNKSAYQQKTEIQKFKRKTSLNRTIQSAQSRVANTTKTSFKISIDDEQFQPVQFPRFFSISAKPCVLYQKKSPNKSMTINFSSSTQVKSNRKLFSRKLKTQASFFQSKTGKTKIMDQIVFPVKSQQRYSQPIINQNGHEQSNKIPAKIIEVSINLDKQFNKSYN